MSKATKQLRKQAQVAEKVAGQSPDTQVAEQMRTLAEAFRVQADIIKKKRKKKK